MGIALSLLVVIGGAVLRYGVTVSPHGLNLAAIGMILIVAGGIGFAASALWMAGQWPFARGGSISWLPGTLSGWTAMCDLKPVPDQTFRQWWQERR